MPGGTLRVDTEALTLEGPAETTYEGTLEMPV